MHKKSIASQDKIYCKFEEIYCQFEEIYCQLKEKYWKFEAKYYDFEVKCTRNLLPAMMKYIARLKVVLNCTRNILPALRNLHEELICQNIFWVLKCARFRYKYFQWFCIQKTYQGNLLHSPQNFDLKN